jgi:hypothetical protein
MAQEIGGMRERIASRTFRNPAGSITIFSRVVFAKSRVSGVVNASSTAPNADFSDIHR